MNRKGKFSTGDRTMKTTQTILIASLFLPMALAVGCDEQIALHYDAPHRDVVYSRPYVIERPPVYHRPAPRLSPPRVILPAPHRPAPPRLRETKKVQLEFVNRSPKRRGVKILLPGRDWKKIGRVKADGGRLRHTLKLDRDDLPLRIRWASGTQSGSVKVKRDFKKSPQEVRIVLKAASKPPKPRRRAEKHVSAVFVNRTRKDLKVKIAVGQGSWRSLGRIEAKGGRLEYDITVARQVIPIKVRWQAGKRKGSFRITLKSPETKKIILKR